MENLIKFIGIKGFLVFVLLSNSLQASHLVGGEMSYKCLGNNQYEIQLKLYRDCNGTGAAFDPLAKIGIFNGSTGALIIQRNVPLPGFIRVPVNTVSSCLVVPPNICIQEAIYKDTVTLPAIAGGYDIVYQRCCRNPSIVNINAPGNMGNTYHSFIPANDTSCNSSPSFNNFPPILICINDPIVFDHSATDLDGDSLVYEFFTPYTGGTSANPAPNPSSPPFSPIGWGPTYNVNNQVRSLPQMNLNSSTGLLTGTPTGLGQFLVGIKVKEFRNGILVSETLRDFQFNVLNCQKSTSSIFDPGVVCNSFNVNFTNNSLNGTTYFWDFGDTTILSDTSLAFAPNYTYLDTGVYRVSLIVDRNSVVCSDTSYLDLRVYPILIPKFDSIENQCFPNNSLNAKASGFFTSNTQIDWNFGAGSIPSTGIDSLVNGIRYTTPGLKTVSVRYREFGCDTSYSDTFRIYQNVISNIDSITTGCKSFIANFSNSSVNPVSYSWDFGDGTTFGDTSNSPSPTYTYPDTGEFVVRLITIGESICADTTYRNVRIFPLLSPSFVMPDNQCLKRNLFDFTAAGGVFPSTTIDWDFGPTAAPSTSNLKIQNGVSYSTAGTKNITLRYRDFGCDTAISGSLIVYSDVLADYSISQDTTCVEDEQTINFISASDPSLIFNWNFGDGNTSNEENPVHLYTSIGNYSSSLIVTDGNCSDTMFLSNPITVLPNPKALFSPMNVTVPGYAAVVDFVNLSTNFVSSNFRTGDGTDVFSFSNYSHTYSDDGYFYPSLVVINEVGCTDSATGRVFVKSETYIPNTFTPDGDGVNDEFKPVFKNSELYELIIFDKWGNIVFQSQNQNESWDGKNLKGNPSKTDTYVYRVSLKYPNEPIQEIFGHINLLK